MYLQGQDLYQEDLLATCLTIGRIQTLLRRLGLAYTGL